jgi:ABC-type polysaccharide/polyol phosphate export permease
MNATAADRAVLAFSRHLLRIPADNFMISALRELVARRDLLYILTWREITVKYKQSVMGMLWAVLMPSIIICAGLVVRYAFATISGRPLAQSDFTSVAVKAAPWAFFVASIRFGTNSLIANTNLVTKIYLPRLVFPLSAVFSQLFDFCIAAVVVGVFLIIVGTGWSIQLLWVPFIISTLIVLTLACAIIFSAASLFFRDVKYIVEVLLTFAIFFTPVFYESRLFGQWAPLLLANPVSPLLEALSSAVVLHQPPSIPWLTYSVGMTVLLIVVATHLFQKLDPYFAESI